MTHDPYELERRRQAAAERPAEAGEDAAVARHRYVLQAIRQLPVPSPPAGFARQVDAWLQDYPEDARAEQWLMRLATVAGLVLAANLFGPWLATHLATLAMPLAGVPWRFLAALAGGLAAFAAFDALRARAASH